MFSRLSHIFFALAILGIFCAWPLNGRAAPLASAAPVKASLVALDEGIQPGKPVMVALKLEHDAHWHTYWINAGTGYPTTIAWTLPEGWQAGEIQWPVPSMIKDRQGSVTGNGYEGVTYLPIVLTAPANLASGSQVTLKGKVDWLMCADICIPGSADVALTLPVVAGAPKASALRASVFATPPMPEKPDGDARIAATRAAGAKTVTLAVSPNPARGSDGAPHFFSSDAFIQYDQPQIAQAGGETLTLTLPVSDSYDGEGRRLAGVLAFKDSKGVYRGYEIDVLLNDSTADAGASLGAVPAATGSAGGIAGTLVFAFIGGLILNLMPCVFPVLGIKILGFVNQAGASRRKVVMHGVAFTAGVLVSFWLLAGALFVLSPGSQGMGWGYQLQYPWVVFCVTVVMLAFALNMSGVFEIGMSMTSVGGKLQSKEGFAGSFFTGALATVVATPCSAPFLGTALGAALVSMTRAESFLVFTVIALGLSTPYLLLSFFPSAVRFLPRPGAWMETFKQFMAFPLYATVGYLLWVLIGQTAEDEFAIRGIMFALVLIAMAAWAYGRFGQAFGNTKRRITGTACAVAFLAGGLWFGWPRSVTEPSVDKTVEQAGSGQKKEVHAVAWEKWSPQAVADARAAGNIVYVDFTARWCATCQVNKAVVFGSDEVLKFFHEHGVVALKADWTSRSAEIGAELARFNRSAVPFNLIYKPGRTEPVVLPELLTPGIVLDALRK